MVYCDEHMCVHIQYAWEIPDVRKILSARKLTPPSPDRSDAAPATAGAKTR